MHIIRKRVDAFTYTHSCAGENTLGPRLGSAALRLLLTSASACVTQVPIVTTPHFISSCLSLFLSSNLRNYNVTEGSVI